MDNKLRELREALSMSQEDLAKASGVGVATISRLENGHVKARTMTRTRLARSLGLPVWMIWPDVRARG